MQRTVGLRLAAGVHCLLAGVPAFTIMHSGEKGERDVVGRKLGGTLFLMWTDCDYEPVGEHYKLHTGSGGF